MLTNRTQKVIALYRVSTDKQDLTRQQTDLLRMLAIDGYDKSQIIEIGNKESAVLLKETEREGLNEMKRHIENGNVAAVYVHELSRLSRQASITFSIRDYLQEHRVQLVCLNPALKCFTDDFKIDPTANMIFGVMASMAENEGFIRKERFKTGKARCKALGKRTCAAITYGYTVDKENTLIVDEERAEDVRTLFRLYATGDYSFLTLSKEMTFRGWKLTPPSVSRVLNNGAYIGKDPHGIKYPRIIDNETWDMCRAVAERKSTRIGLGHKRHWLAAKLIECSDCGCHFTVYGRIEYPSYTCPFNSHKKTFGDKCNNNTRFPSLNFDNLLFGVIVEQEMKRRNVNKEEVAEKLIKEIDDATEKIESIEGELNAAIGAKLDRLEERYIDGAITKQKLERLRQHVLDEQSDLQSELYRLRELKTVKQQQWSDLMGDSVMGNVIDFETWLDSETISKISHDLIKNIKAFRNEDGYVDLSIYCFSGDVYNYQYRPTHGFGGKNWFRRENNGDYTLLKNPKCERNDKNDTVLYHRTTIWE